MNPRRDAAALTASVTPVTPTESGRVAVQLTSQRCKSGQPDQSSVQQLFVVGPHGRVARGEHRNGARHQDQERKRHQRRVVREETCVGVCPKVWYAAMENNREAGDELLHRSRLGRKLRSPRTGPDV